MRDKKYGLGRWLYMLARTMTEGFTYKPVIYEEGKLAAL
jgi:hypothetical protein